MPIPQFENLYSLNDPVAKRPYRGKFEPHEFGLGLSRGDAACNRLIKVTWAMGAALPGDVIWTTAASPLIVHARVLDLLEEHAFTGWAAYPVSVWSKSHEQVQDYVGLAITGRCGRVDLSQSSVVLRQFAGGWIHHFLGHYFPPESWDGSDLFMEAPDALGKTTACRFATARVRETLLKAKVNNLTFTLLTEKCVLCSVYTIALKHLLPHDFENRVAAAYEEADVPRPHLL